MAANEIASLITALGCELEKKSLSSDNVATICDKIFAFTSERRATASTITNEISTNADAVSVSATIAVDSIQTHIGGPSDEPEHNMVGKFSADSSPDDWFWYPNGEKLAIPVDPVTGEFSYFFDGEITVNTLSHLFNPDYVYNTLPITPLERWDKMPPFKSLFRFDTINHCKVLPILDCHNKAMALNYCFMNPIAIYQAKRIHFANTQNVTSLRQTFAFPRDSNVISITGLDLSSLVNLDYSAFGSNVGVPYIQLTNLGKREDVTNATFDLRSPRWGDDSMATGARQSLVDSLLTHSFDRATAGYSTITLWLSRRQYNRLTESEIAAITAKGYTFALDETYA